MGRSKASAPISNRDTVALLKAWGFEQAEGNGGHIVFTLNGQRVQVTAPGRHTPTPYAALRKAAKAAGVSTSKFMAGPTKEKRVEVKSIDTTVVTSGATEPVVRPLDPRIGFKITSLKPETKGFVCPDENCDKVYPTQKGMNVHRRIHLRGNCSKCGLEFDMHGIYPHQKRCDGTPYERDERGRMIKPRNIRKVEVETDVEDDGPLVAPLPKDEPKRAPLVPDSPVAPDRRVGIETEVEEVRDLFELVIPADKNFTSGGLRVLAQWIEATEELYEVLNG